MTALLRRIGGVLLAPRALLASLSEETGRRDGAVLLLAYALAVAVPEASEALADLLALGGLHGLLGLARGLLPLLPWLVAGAVVEWRLGPARAHRAALCLVPMLLLVTLAHLLAGRGVVLPGPWYLPTAIAGLISVLLAGWVRAAIPPAADTPPVQPQAPAAAVSHPADPPATAVVADLSQKPATSVVADLSEKPATSVVADLSEKPATSVVADLSLKPATAIDADLSHQPATAIDADLSQKPALSRRAVLVGGSLTALVGTSAALDLGRAVARWPTLGPVTAGDPVPDFSVALLDGGRLSAGDLRAGPHLLIFWTTWCGVCAAQMPMYRALAERHAARGLRVIAVAADREGDVPALVRAYRAERGLPFPIALDDGAMTRGFRVRMFPHLVLIDAAGQIRGVFQGRTFERSLDAALAALT